MALVQLRGEHYRITLAALALSSCTGLGLPDIVERREDEESKAADLRITVETSPQPDAIVGMWFRNADYRDGTTIKVDRESILIRADGTMIRKHRYGRKGRINTSDVLSWKYAGGGKWVAGNAILQLSQGKLLWHLIGFQVYEQIRSGNAAENP